MKTSKNLLLAAIVLAASCTSTKTTSSWRSPDIRPGYLSGKKIMVVALLPEKDRELQKSMESQLAGDLASKGVQAVSGYETFGPKYIPEDEQKALQKLRKAGVNDVLTVVLLDKDKQKSFTPGRVDVVPVGYYRTWFGYYRTVYSRIYSPGYYTSDTKLYWESNLYDLSENKLLYSSQSESFDPSSVSQLASDYSKRLVDDMTKQKLVALE
jgi:hypothetical protein